MSVRRLAKEQPASFAFKPETLKLARWWMSKYPPGRQRSAVVPVLWLVLLGFVLRVAYEVQGTVFYSHYKDSFTLFSGLFVIALSIVANVILIPPFALDGAASAIIISYGAGIVARRMMITSYFR